MDMAVQLYGFLLLTLLGIVTPLIAILLPIFSVGVLELTKKYNSEQSRASENLKKIATASKTDLKAIQMSVHELEKLQKQATSKLSYLNPKKPIVHLFLALLISFLGVIFYLILNKYWLSSLICIIISLFLFSLSIKIMWGLLNVLIEARQVIDENKKDTAAQTIKLLTTMIEKTTSEKEPYLKDICIYLDGVPLKNDNMNIDIEYDKEQKLLIEFINSEKRMVKNLEIGFTFPYEFVISKKDTYSIYSGDINQVVRFEYTFVHGNTNLKFGHVVIKPIKKGDYKIKAFIKAENIETIYRYFMIKVTEPASSNQIQKGS